MKMDSIKTEHEYNEILTWIDNQFDRKIPSITPKGEILQNAPLSRVGLGEHPVIQAKIALE